jgi:homoserine kinase
VEGERVACGSAHADNAAPAIYGGFVLIRSADPPDVVPLPVPDGLACAVVRPHLEVETRGARAVLGDTVPLRAAVAQWGNLGALVAALFRSDLDLLARSLVDAVAEPKRAGSVPGFRAAQHAAVAAGALGAGLSGSGPTLFALCPDRATAGRAAEAIAEALAAEGLGADRYTSRVGVAGARVL